MSVSEASVTYRLSIIVAQQYQYLSRILIFNSKNRIVSTDNPRYEQTFDLPKGLYTIRIELNGEFKDQVIVLDSNKTYRIDDASYDQQEDKNLIEPPRQFSSALLSGINSKTYTSSHEYYTGPAVSYSQVDTFPSPVENSANLNSSLFIFMRFPSIEKYNELKKSWPRPFYKDFEIVNEQGVSLIQFESSRGVSVQEGDGWLAFNAKLANGIYYLIYKGPDSRQVPIYVFKNWHTQFFITLGEQPLFGSIRIFISKERRFDPTERTNKYIDILLDKLQNGDYTLDQELIREAAHGKYESPMLGLICSYVYLKSKQTGNDDLFNVILRNMQNVILKDNDESPDIRALNLMASDHFKSVPTTIPIKRSAVKGTPMLRIGFEAIRNKSIVYKRLIPSNSLNDFISETIFFDSPFNTFKPIPFYKEPTWIQEMENIQEIKNIELPPTEAFGTHGQMFGDGNFKRTNKGLKRSVVVDPLDFIKESRKIIGSEQSNWVRNSILDLMDANKDIQVKEISEELNLSANTITRIFNDWKKEIKLKRRK